MNAYKLYDLLERAASPEMADWLRSRRDTVVLPVLAMWLSEVQANTVRAVPYWQVKRVFRGHPVTTIVKTFQRIFKPKGLTITYNKRSERFEIKPLGDAPFTDALFDAVNDVFPGQVDSRHRRFVDAPVEVDLTYGYRGANDRVLFNEAYQKDLESVIDMTRQKYKTAAELVRFAYERIGERIRNLSPGATETPGQALAKFQPFSPGYSILVEDSGGRVIGRLERLYQGYRWDGTVPLDALFSDPEQLNRDGFALVESRYAYPSELYNNGEWVQTNRAALAQEKAYSSDPGRRWPHQEFIQ